MGPEPDDVDEVLCPVCSNTTGSDDSLLLCDNCGCGVHMECLEPPLSAIPEGLWLCPPCRSGEGRSAFYQRRERADDSFRLFFSTPAQARPRERLTDTIVIAPLDVRMAVEPTGGQLSTLPALSGAMLDKLAVVRELLRGYLPTLHVRVREPEVHVLRHDKALTRGDKQGTRTDDGKRVRQLSSDGVQGARAPIDAEAEGAPPFITFLVALHLYPANAAKTYAWVYSTMLDEGHDVDAWVVSTFQIERHVEEGAAQTKMLCQMVLYCVFMEALELEVCENRPCLMNNCDSVDEAMELSLMLCPTCMRKLHLMGVVNDMCASEERIVGVLKLHGLI